MKEKKLNYNGLTTQRITVIQQSPILSASVRNNKVKVKNASNWEHDSDDEKTLGIGTTDIHDTHFDFTFD